MNPDKNEAVPRPTGIGVGQVGQAPRKGTKYLARLVLLRSQGVPKGVPQGGTERDGMGQTQTADRLPEADLDRDGFPVAQCAKCGGGNFWRISRLYADHDPLAWNCSRCQSMTGNRHTDGCSLSAHKIADDTQATGGSNDG